MLQQQSCLTHWINWFLLIIQVIGLD
jgi:hypothetical protein